MQVITINQDELGKQGAPVWSNCPTFEPCAARPPPATPPHPTPSRQLPRPRRDSCPALGGGRRDNWWMSPWSMPYDVACAWTAVLAALIAVCLTSGWACARWLGQRQPAATVTARSTRAATKRAANANGAAGRTAAARCRGPLCCFGLAALCACYASIIWSYRPTVDACQQVWARPLASGAHALCFINFAPHEATTTCDTACLRGLSITTRARVRDVVARRNLDVVDVTDGLSVTLAGDGGSALYVVDTG